MAKSPPMVDFSSLRGAPGTRSTCSQGRTGGSLFVEGPSTDHKHDWETTGLRGGSPVSNPPSAGVARARDRDTIQTQDVAAILGEAQRLLQACTNTIWVIPMYW